METNTPQRPEKLAENPNARFEQDRKRIMDKQWYNSTFYSISQVSMFLAGTMLAAGMAIIGPALKDVSFTSGIGSALSQLPAIGVAFMGTAAVMSAIAAGTNFLSSRFFQSATLDTSEMNARHCAEYTAKEISKQHAQDPVVVVVQQNENTARADGKPWTQVIAEQQQARTTQQAI